MSTACPLLLGNQTKGGKSKKKKKSKSFLQVYLLRTREGEENRRESTCVLMNGQNTLLLCFRNIIEGNTFLLLKRPPPRNGHLHTNTSEEILLNLCSQSAVAIIHCTELTLSVLFFSDKIMSAKV